MKSQVKSRQESFFYPKNNSHIEKALQFFNASPHENA